MIGVTDLAALDRIGNSMCTGNSYSDLHRDFDRRVQEREFPTCPPDDRSTRLLFTDANNKVGLHHGAVFAFTRWTNLYFRLHELFWGDAIGGRLSDLFGPFIRDKEVSTLAPKKDVFFSHTYYWDLSWP